MMKFYPNDMLTIGEGNIFLNNSLQKSYKCKNIQKKKLKGN